MVFSEWDKNMNLPRSGERPYLPLGVSHLQAVAGGVRGLIWVQMAGTPPSRLPGWGGEPLIHLLCAFRWLHRLTIT